MKSPLKVIGKKIKEKKNKEKASLSEFYSCLYSLSSKCSDIRKVHPFTSFGCFTFQEIWAETEFLKSSQSGVMYLEFPS